jgi:hypothetical protein
VKEEEKKRARSSILSNNGYLALEIRPPFPRYDPEFHASPLEILFSAAQSSVSMRVGLPFPTSDVEDVELRAYDVNDNLGTIK